MILRAVAALRAALPPFFVAGAALCRDAWDEKTAKRQNALVRGRQLCIQLSIFAGSLVELLRFSC